MTAPTARTYSQIALDVLPYATEMGVPKELLHSTTLETVPYEVFRGLVVRLRKDLLAHRVQVDDVDIPVRGRLPLAPARDVLVELPRPWWARFLRRRPRRVWVPLGDEVAHRPVTEVTIHDRGRPVACPVVGQASIARGVGQIQVGGVATVRANYFKTFPESTIRYSDDLGRPRSLVLADEPRGWAPEVAG